MKKLARGIITVIVDEYGQDEFLRRLSDPFWFQALGCVLGYDWHSSGVTTVVTGVLREVVKPKDHGLAVAGGKGKRSMQVPTEIDQFVSIFGLSPEEGTKLKYASRMGAKVDNTAIQAGFPLYHHAFFMTGEGKWAIIQQGMSIKEKIARRYHWLSDHVKSFVEEPHDAIVCDVTRELALNMVSRESEDCRRISVDLAKEGVRRVRRDLASIRPKHQKALTEWLEGVRDKSYASEILTMPRNVNWDALKKAYDVQPKNYEELFSIRGLGPATVRALALISEIIYGAPPSWKDPVKYSFAFGGKDGVPRPVDRKAMDEAIVFLEHIIDKSKIEKKEKYSTLERLRRYAPSTLV